VYPLSVAVVLSTDSLEAAVQKRVVRILGLVSGELPLASWTKEEPYNLALASYKIIRFFLKKKAYATYYL
jgi:hypothetical protein